jgi:hypothetical protein
VSQVAALAMAPLWPRPTLEHNIFKTVFLNSSPPDFNTL